jgi:hypothetical protein
MPRRSILSVIERDSLLAIPDTQDDLIRLYTFSEHDLSIAARQINWASPFNYATCVTQVCCLRRKTAHLHHY